MAILSFNEALKKSGVKANQVTSLGVPNVQTSQSPKDTSMGKLLAPAKESLQGLGQLYGGGSNGIANKLKNDITSGTQDIQQGTDRGGFSGALQAVKGIAKTGLRTAGDVAGAIYAPVGAAIGATGIGKATEAAGNYLVNHTAAGQAGANNPEMQKFAMVHPNAGEDFNRATNLVTAGMDTGTLDPKTALERTKAQLTPIPHPSVDTPNANLNNISNSVAEKLQLKPDQIMQRVARIPKAKQARFQQVAGESVGQYLTKRGIFGNVDEISQQLYDRFTKSKGTADAAFEQLPGTYQPAPVKTMLQELINREKKVSTPGAPSADLGTIQQLATNFKNKGLSHPEINMVKRLYEKNNTMDYLRQNAPESVAKAKNIDTAVREWQRQQAKLHGLNNLEQINKETQLSKQLLDALGKEHSGQSGNNAISLTDWIMLSGGDPTSIAGFLAKKTFSSESVRSAIAKALNKGNPVMGDVSAEMGQSQVPQLPARSIPNEIVSENYTPPTLTTNRAPDEAMGEITKTTRVNPKTGDAYIRNLKTGEMQYSPRKTNTSDKTQPTQQSPQKLKSTYNSNVPRTNSASTELSPTARKTIKIHPEDLSEMSDFVDYVSGEYKPKSESSFKYYTRKMAQKYGIPANVSDKVLRNKFLKLLDEHKFRN